MPGTALITGILGQDGSLLAELLLSRGQRVIGVARPGAASAAPVGVTMIDVDLHDTTQVRRALEAWRPDELYHLAAAHHAAEESSRHGHMAGKAVMLAINFGATQTLVLALAEMLPACALVFASSSQMYTAREACHRIDETSPVDPSSFYGWTKAWSVQLLAQLRAERVVRASSAILFNHESPRRGPSFVSRKITRAAARAAAGHPVELKLGNIGARVDWSSARDVVTALAAIAAHDAGQDFVVASGRLRSVKDWLEIAFGSVDLDWRAHATYEEDREVPALVGDSEAARRVLAWQPADSFADVVRAMVASDRHELLSSAA